MHGIAFSFQDITRRKEMEADYAEQRQALNTFRAQRGLTRASDLSEWLDEHELTEDELSQLLVEELFVSDLFRADAPRLNAHVLDLLKLEGRYARLADRAEAKRITLERIGCSGSGQALEKSGLTPPDLLQWYFHQQRGEVPPVDIDAYVADRGVNSREQLYEILAREYLYLGRRTEED